MLCWYGKSSVNKARSHQDVVILPPPILSKALEELSALRSVGLGVREVIRERRHLAVPYRSWAFCVSNGTLFRCGDLAMETFLESPSSSAALDLDLDRNLNVNLNLKETVNHPSKIMTDNNTSSLIPPSSAPHSEAEYETGSEDDNSSDEPLLITEEVKCPPNKVGTVIGAKGSNFNEIMNRSNCKLLMRQENTDHPKISITGCYEDVQYAKTLIASVIAEGPAVLHSESAPESPHPIVTDNMECPCDKVSLVIGAKGVVIQDIMRRSRCKIIVDQDYPLGAPRIIVIQGRQPQIDVAKALLQLVIEDGPNALHQPGVVGNSGHVTEELECPQERVGIVIGSRGSIVQEIMKRTACRIVVHQDMPEGEPRIVMITGTPPQVKAARALVQAVIVEGPMAIQGPAMGGSNSDGTVSQDLRLVQSQVGKLIGPGGSTIKDIQQRFLVRMNIDQPSPHTEDRKLRITGEPSNVQAVVQFIWHLVNANGTPPGPLFVPLAPSPPPQFFPPPLPHPPLPPPPPPQAIGQGLGADGSSGRLMPPTPLGNGLVHQVPRSPRLRLTHPSQVVYLLKPLLARVVGDQSQILQLIVAKSGANVQVEQSPVIATGGQELSRMNVIGMAAGVTLAGQMIQEVPPPLSFAPSSRSSLPSSTGSDQWSREALPSARG
jgi:rRNA processing protein Krr1/Pno1